MDRALHDENFVPTMIAALNTDGETVVAVTAASQAHAISINDGTSGTSVGSTVAVKDANGVSSIMAVSSADGVTPVVLYTDSSGKLLIQST